MPDPTDTQATRRTEILAAGLSVMMEKGWRGTSMLAVARQAKTSKETLYNWFGDKAGFFAAMIRQNAGDLDAVLPTEFGQMSLKDGLHAFGRAYLRLVTGPESLALNRAAIAEAGHDPGLGKLLLQEGKAKSLPRLAKWLKQHLNIDDPEHAAERFIVLVKGDLQLECLLGGAVSPSDQKIETQVERAVSDFLTLYRIV